MQRKRRREKGTRLSRGAAKDDVEERPIGLLEDHRNDLLSSIDRIHGTSSNR